MQIQPTQKAARLICGVRQKQATTKHMGTEEQWN
jgi:hypothetical protein